MRVEYSGQILKNTQILNFMKIRPVGAEMFHADRRTDKHDEANSRFSQFCWRTLKSDNPEEMQDYILQECVYDLS